MTLFVLNQRPVVFAIFQHIVLDNFILGGIIRILTDTTCELWMVCVNTGINDGYCNPATGIARPHILHVHIIQICLQFVVSIRY